jgi:hypothetical protein
VVALDAASSQALCCCIVSSCNFLLQSLDVVSVVIIINAADRVMPNNEIWLPLSLPSSCSIVISCSDDWGSFATCLLCSGMPNSSLFVIPDTACVNDHATVAALVVRFNASLQRNSVTNAQVVDGRITSAEMSGNRVDVRNMNQRVPVDVTESLAFRNACGMRSLGDGECDGVDLKLDDVRSTLSVRDCHIAQIRMIVLQCAGLEAVGNVAGVSAERLQMWLLEHVCRPHSLNLQVAARMLLYLGISRDGLPGALLLDVTILDYYIDMQARNLPINPAFISLCRSVVPCMMLACARVRLVCVSQRSGAYDGLLWQLASPKLLPLLEDAAGMKVHQARSTLLEYFEGGMKRYMARLNHTFHDQAPSFHQAVRGSNESDAGNLEASGFNFTPASSIRIPPPPPFNLHRMIEGTTLAIALGALELARCSSSLLCGRHAFIRRLQVMPRVPFRSLYRMCETLLRRGTADGPSQCCN